eukprot:786369-Rhodomonas_salina.1
MITRAVYYCALFALWLVMYMIAQLGARGRQASLKPDGTPMTPEEQEEAAAAAAAVPVKPSKPLTRCGSVCVDAGVVVGVVRARWSVGQGVEVKGDELEGGFVRGARP